MKRTVTFAIFLIFSLVISAQGTNEYYIAYIQKYYKQAQTEQKKHGIPASITLAQGLLESAAGRSELATQANNHFGVKCSGGWTGDTFLKDDDKKDDCFRKYKHVSQSFEDHSQFLLRDRYKPLFQLDVTDYKGWAHGLKQCGYATDPGYAGKLIKIIEDYNLTQYDVAQVKKEQTPVKSNMQPAVQKSKTDASAKNADADIDLDEPEDVVAVAFKTKKGKKNMSAVDLVLEHKVCRNNGSRYVVARQGDTFASLAYEYNIYEKTLRRYNDIVNPRYELCEGDKVYLYPKRSRAARKYAKYRVKHGENIWQIAQDKGIKLKSVYRLNGIEEGQNVTVNQELRLR
ncbi:MAG: glucosaminidase domain-containing protein [Paludibacteraceae bacterium]|nr:glucosaminidase domain-containing protein [Paludibacteraceae bacterium]